MASTEQFKQFLFREASSDEAKKKELELWRAELAASIKNGDSGQITNGSGNGISFAQSAGMTNLECLSVVDYVLYCVMIGFMPSSRTLARLI
jgi:hypothetical protein